MIKALPLFLLFLVSCNNEISIPKKSFAQLPVDVQIAFKEIYNYKPVNDSFYLPPFIECRNVNGATCTTELKYNALTSLLFAQKIIITCDRKSAEVDFSNLERMFVLKNDTLYYPDAPVGGATMVGEARSKLIKIDTLKFKSIKTQIIND